MKQTKGAIGNLLSRYRAVLKKCHLLNTFGSLAVASMLVMGAPSVVEANVVITGTVTMEEDMSSDTSWVYGVASNTSATLDLNGHSVVSTYSYGVLANGTITIQDTSGNGYIQGHSIGVVASGENAQLIMKGGEIYSSNTGWAVQIEQGASAQITGGTISNEMNGLILITAGAGMTASAVIDGDTVIKTTGTYVESPDAESHVAIFLQPDNENAPVSLTVNNGSIESEVFAIAGNGTRHGTNILINGGNIISHKSTAIYHPQYGTMTITGGTITGAQTGIELRSGKLDISGGSITGNGNPFKADPNGNGTTTIGSALAISQHTTNKDIDVDISGGTFTGYYALFENDLYDDLVDNISIKVTGGEFNGKIYSENVKEFITGGTFSDPTALHYLGDGADVSVNLQADYTGETGTLNKKAFEIGENRTVSMDLGGHTFSMTETGNTSAGNVSISNGTLNLNQGLTLTDGSWDMVSGSNLTIAEGASLTLNGGTFVSDADLLLAEDYSAKEGITDAKIIGTSGNLNLRLDGTTYTIEEYKAAKEALLNQTSENAVLNFLNGTLHVQDDEQLVAGASGENGALTLTTGPVVVDETTSASDAQKAQAGQTVPEQYVAVVNESSTGTKELLQASSITINNNFTARGLQIKNTNGAESVQLTVGDGKSTNVVRLVGDSINDTGVIDEGDNTLTTTADVKANATLNMGLEGNTENQGLTLDEATVSGTLNANGGVQGTTSQYAINKLTMNANSKVNILDSTMEIGEFTATGGTMFVDPAYVNIAGLADGEFGTQLLVGEGSVVNIGGTTDDDLRAAMAESGITAGPNMTVGGSNSVLAVALPITLGGNGKIVVDASVKEDGTLGDGQSPTAVHFGDGSLLIMDASKLDGAAAIKGASSQQAVITSGSRLYILNAVKGDMTVLSSFQSVSSGEERKDIGWIKGHVNPDRMLKTSVETVKNGEVYDVVVSNSVNTASEVLPGLDEEFNPAMNHVWNNTLNDVNSDDMGIRFLSRAANSDYIADANKAAATIESAARMAFAGAVPQMTKMASDSATNAVVNRMGFANPENGAKAMNVDGKLVDDKALGLALWIAPLWSNQTGFGMEAGNLDYGYNANIGGISLGADYTWANNFRAGLMFNIGGGYAESAGGELSETTNSMTFWGVGAYGGWKYENFAVMGDVSYTSTWNSVDQDVDHRMGMGDLESDIQASAISAGLRFEYKLETQYLDLIPHVGVRYMSINTWGYDVDSADGTILEGDGFQQNIWTFPVGITFSKELEMNNDWYFKPSVDFTVIPAAGDIKAKQDVRFGNLPSVELETQMMDYFTWQGGLGLEFGNDNMSVGVNYTLQAGQNSTGHGVFGMFRYEF